MSYKPAILYKDPVAEEILPLKMNNSHFCACVLWDQKSIDTLIFKKSENIDLWLLSFYTNSVDWVTYYLFFKFVIEIIKFINLQNVTKKATDLRGFHINSINGNSC